MSAFVAEDIKLIGQSPPFLDLMDRVSRLAPLDRPALVIGERGTGKELICRRLHFLSSRWENPFIQINCAALPDTLLESELFGYEPGAFTGAAGRRAGRFEEADGGTLFLDEIASLSQTAQEKLLRIIEYGQFERLGGNETQTVDVRILGATNIDLPAAAETGRFRPDLLDRLAFDVLTVPPLRVRPEDLPELIAHFGRAMAIELGWPAYPGFSSSAMEMLVGHSWPGNVRELKNVVERAVSAWTDPETPIETVVFDPFDSPFRPRSHRPLSGPADAPDPGPVPHRPEAPGMTPVDFKATVAEYERTVLENALKANRFHQRATARHLDLSYDQLRHALKKHGLL